MNKLDNAIKVALKTKQGKRLTRKQVKAVELLQQNGFLITNGSENSYYGYNMISKTDSQGNNVTMFISKISDTNKGGVFIESPNVESFYHDMVVGRDINQPTWNDEFKKLGYVYDHYNLLDEFNNYLK